MKNEKSISEKLAEAKIAIARAKAIHETLLRQRLVKRTLQFANSIVLLLFFTCAQAQTLNFTDINAIGVYSDNLKKVITGKMFFKGQNYYEGQRLDYYFEGSYGLIGFVFDKNNVCTKVVLPTKSKWTYIVKGYTTREVEGTNMTIIE